MLERVVVASRKRARARDVHESGKTSSISHTEAGLIDPIPACRKPGDIWYGALSANAAMKSRVIFTLLMMLR